MLRAIKNLIPHRHPIRLAWHHIKALLAAVYFGFPAKKLTVIGVTGTDGKTTTAAMISHILHYTGRQVGAATTAFFDINGARTENATHLTSITAWQLQSFLRGLVKQGVEYAVLEISSHGLVQGRCNHTYPAVACITNISLEHLDFHGTMQQYIADKGILFRMLKDQGTKILNRSDETYPVYSAIQSTHTITYNGKDSDLRAENRKAHPLGSTANVTFGKEQAALTLNLPGLFNIDNALTAIGAAIAIGIPFAEAVAAMTTFAPAPGRMERIDEGQDFSVYVDFTVSPQSYEKVLESLRAVAGDSGRVLILCSSCGNRMAEKRPIIGKLCSQLADVVVATEDETYGEDPHKVLDEVWAGIDQSACEAHKIFDRREAITFLFKEAKAGDAVALCGMGPFSSFKKLEGDIEWDERIIARELLRHG